MSETQDSYITSRINCRANNSLVVNPFADLIGKRVCFRIDGYVTMREYRVLHAVGKWAKMLDLKYSDILWVSVDSVDLVRIPFEEEKQQ